MSGPTKDLFGEPNETACSCGEIHKTPEKALQCRIARDREQGRERARKFARTGVSQRKGDVMKCQAQAMALLHFNDDELEPCFEEAGEHVEGFELCEGCADALERIRYFADRVVEAQS